MHFFYIDESGDTGNDLSNEEQPIMVLGGISISEERWNNTQMAFEEIISDFFNGTVSDDFELHSTQLLPLSGEGPFAEHPLDDRIELAKKLLK